MKMVFDINVKQINGQIFKINCRSVHCTVGIINNVLPLGYNFMVRIQWSCLFTMLS